MHFSPSPFQDVQTNPDATSTLHFTKFFDGADKALGEGAINAFCDIAKAAQSCRNLSDLALFQNMKGMGLPDFVEAIIKIIQKARNIDINGIFGSGGPPVSTPDLQTSGLVSAGASHD